jgi:hypothetical protein
MTKTRKDHQKNIENLQWSIELHEKAVADAQEKADAAEAQLIAYKRAKVAEQLEDSRPRGLPYGDQKTLPRAQFAVLDKDPDRERLEQDTARAKGEVTRLQRKLNILRDLLRLEREKLAESE